MLKPEVLAPVGSREMLTAALRCGADAVYLGAKDFNARRNADNFDIAQLSEAVAYCHEYGVQVYLTLNICLKDSEMPLAVELSKKAARMGIDGIIIADLGLARSLKRACPDLPLHASTQLTVHSPSALYMLKDMGFKRVVLSREVSRDVMTQICETAKQLELETEVFVHGALCMSMSGQCLLSAVLGGRSGNRGLCAGPCRLPFLAEGGSGHDLSLKDLCLIKYVNELSALGVTSLKIEGRMKRPEYVAAAVSAYRNAVDGEDYSHNLKLLTDVFARSGFTDGYFTDKKSKEMFGTRTREEVLAANDVFAEIHSLYRTERQSIGVAADFCAKKGQPISLTLSCGEYSVTATGDKPEAAVNRPIDYEFVKANISKLGSTPYYLTEFSAETEDNLSVRASQLNALRRAACEALTAERIKVKKQSFSDFEPIVVDNAEPTEQKIICRFFDESQIPADLSGVYAVAFPIEKNPPKLPEGILKIADIPRGILNEEAIKARLEIFKIAGYTLALVGNIAAAKIAEELGFKIMGDFGLNIYNSHAAEAWANKGTDMLTVSPELTLKTAKEIKTGAKTGIIAYGRLPLMLTANCPLKNGKTCDKCKGEGVITDRLGISFPVRCRMGFSELLNSKPTYVLDKKGDIKGFDFLTLYFTTENRTDAEKIINCAKQNSPAEGDITRGMYYKGVE